MTVFLRFPTFYSFLNIYWTKVGQIVGKFGNVKNSEYLMKDMAKYHYFHLLKFISCFCVKSIAYVYTYWTQ